MNKKIRRKVIVFVFLVIFSTNVILIANNSKVSGKDFYLTLKARLYNSWSSNVGYLDLMQQQLARIGIKLEIEILEWGTLHLPASYFTKHDMTIISLNDYRKNFDISTIYQENSSLNIFGYYTDMDCDDCIGPGKNEWYIRQDKLIMPPNSEERKQHNHEWQDYMMDELLLTQPLFTNAQYDQSWKEINGYNYCNGILQSWGKMSWSSQHPGQISTDEIVVVEPHWSDLNPLFQDDSSSKFISDAILDPLFWIDYDKTYQPHLATSFEMLNDTHVRIHLREGIKWQTDPDGIFTNEYFDAGDVYFTLVSWREMSNDQEYYDWLEDMKIIDDYTIDLYIDNDPRTLENEPSSDFLDKIAVNILPEHYLNQTQFANGDTDITHSSWNTFYKNCFGTGLFEFDTFTEGVETILTVNPDSWWLNTSITNDPALDWTSRFGDFTGGLNQLRVRIWYGIDAGVEFDSGRADISRTIYTKPLENDKYTTQSKLRTFIVLLAYNVRPERSIIGNPEPCKNDPSITKGLAIRKAISYAIDRDEINNIVNGNEYIITDYPIFESQGIWCNPNIIRYNQDLEQAMYYIELAGFTATTHTIEIDLLVIFQLSISVLIFVRFYKRKKGRIKVDKSNKTKIIVYFVAGLLILNGLLVINSKQVQAVEPFFTIVLKATETSDNHGYSNLIVQQCIKYGINIDYVVQGWPTFVGELIAFRNFDLAIINLRERYARPNLMQLFGENGSLNLFGYHTSMDWDTKLETGKNQWYLEQMSAMFPPFSEERIKHYRNWEQYMMDELLLMLPLFTKKIHRMYWDNLEGFNLTEGILQSWGKMNWNGMHTEQSNTSEIVMSDDQWEGLNPLFQNSWDAAYTSSKFMSSLILDPLFWQETDGSVKPHLAKSFTMINDTHARITLREGVKWQTDPEGNFTDEYFDAEDVYFTLFCRKNYLSENALYRIDWLKDMKIIDSHTIDLFIDKSKYTEENEPNADFLVELCKMVLPEHYLNQTQSESGEPEINHPAWLTYETNCFGTGLFELKSYYTGFETILNVNPNSWWLNSTVNNDPLLDWEQRFGSFSSNISQLRVKVHQNTEAALLEFDAGLIDITPEFYIKTIPTIGCDIQEKMEDHLSLMAFNCREVRPIIGNREPCPGDPSITKGLAIRKAIAYAIDKIEINNIITGGNYYLADHPIQESQTIWCNPNLIHYDHNLEMVKYYLALAGYYSVISGLGPFDLLCLTFSVLVVILVFKRKQIKRKQ